MQDFYAVFPYSPGPWNSKLSLHLWDEHIQSQKFSEVFSLQKRRKMKMPEYQEVLRTWVFEITVVDIIDRGESLLTDQTGRKYPSSCYL